MAEKKNICFDPQRYPDRANYILKQIKDAIENPHTEYKIEPSPDRNNNMFKSITGTMRDGGDIKEFKVEHKMPKTQSESERMYVMYNNIEFYSDWGNNVGFKINIIGLIDNFINNEYVYDMNSNSYVELPREMTWSDKLDNWLTRMKAGSTRKKQKTK